MGQRATGAYCPRAVPHAAQVARLDVLRPAHRPRARPVRHPELRTAPAVRLALAGDTMLGRGVAEALSSRPSPALFSAEVVEATRAADLCVLNLECCISERGAPWPARAFHFRAPPAAAEALADLGVDCVTLANNHALDFGPWALYRRAGMSRWSMERSGDRRAGARHHTEDLHCTPARSPALKMGNSARLGHLSEIRHKAITDVQKGERRLRPMGAHRRIRARRRP